MLKCLGADAAEMAVASIVEHLDVIEDIGTRQVAGLVDASLDALLLQAAEKRFRHRVIPAITAATHAGFEVVGFQKA